MVERQIHDLDAYSRLVAAASGLTFGGRQRSARPSLTNPVVTIVKNAPRAGNARPPSFNELRLGVRRNQYLRTVAGIPALVFQSFSRCFA
jgi:hypothetical protein